MPMRKKKGMAGEANKYISRNRAVRKLQLSLYSFNRLCIIKGLFPIEPKSRIKAQKGDSKYRPLYLKKDIQFLMHDPLIWTIRNENSGFKKLRKARHLKDFSKQRVVKHNKPVYRLDQNVLERYPAFIDAVKDLADPLTMIFLFSSIPSRSPIKEHHISRCQRLRTEFLTYVIEAQCLSKAFIATKGYYYEVEIMGRRVVWTVPHNCVTEVPRNADMRIMKHFLEFHIAMLGFVNFRLLSKVNLRYPLMPAVIPKLTGPEKKDLDNFKNLMASLNYPLARTQDKEQTVAEEATELDSHLIEGSTTQTKKAYSESMQGVIRRKLFVGLKFFISQENNRESLTLVIRSCGGEVSWPSTLYPCSTYSEDDQRVTHQIVDRPNADKKYLSRYYVQPQWVYDCLNSVTLLPVQAYFPDVELPPHVCPFLKNYEGWYVPPEEETLRKLLESSPEEKEELLAKLNKDEQDRLAMMRASKAADSNSEDEEDDDLSDNLNVSTNYPTRDSDDEETKEDEKNNSESSVEADEEVEDDLNGGMEVDGDDDDEEGNSADDTVATPAEEEKKDAPKKPEVRRGRELIIQEKVEQEKEMSNEYKMKAFMIHKKNRNLYNKLRAKEAKQTGQSARLVERRQLIEDHKMGKITLAERDARKPRKKPTTIHEKKSARYKQEVKEAVKFAKSVHNKHRIRKDKSKDE